MPLWLKHKQNLKSVNCFFDYQACEDDDEEVKFEIDTIGDPDLKLVDNNPDEFESIKRLVKKIKK